MTYVLYGLGALIALYVGCLLFKMLFPTKCPKCQSKNIVEKASVRSTFVQSERASPDLNTYFLCGDCNARSKRHKGQWSDVEDLEWNRAVKPGTPST